ncbi:MAG TPA: hypothetical protein VK192_09455 [Sphingomicrobium sp.]|jgi:hypothetical protein|nr:hypothetical protein [Sphingomicrobium sp.]
MRHISPIKAGIAVGSLIGLWHLIWVTLVGIGWAKPVMDFILRLHFINLQYSLAPFSAVVAGELVILTFAIGAVFGLAFALVWNWLNFESAPTWARDTKHPAPAE